VLAIKVPLPLHQVILDRAASAGLTITDYVAGVLAAATHGPVRAELEQAPTIWAGPREVLNVRVPLTLGEQIVEAADTADMTISDYGANLLSVAHGEPPVVARSRYEQEELQLGA
jgi:hypothetical protein